jgi:Transcriptional regulator PadR-like family
MDSENSQHTSSGGRPSAAPVGYWSSSRLRRGAMRGLVLAALLQGAAHGYELMRRLEEQTGGWWRPSPGSMYPLLQALEGEGLAAGRDDGGRRVYELTDAGRNQASVEGLCGLTTARPPERRELDLAVAELCGVASHLAAVGDTSQKKQAMAIVRAACQTLYRLRSGTVSE